ncbi:hypothetical protein KSZ_13190 [Dictyobacter formicarum]|uniref:Uncharacterized protein n=1 Tax=Dictyobacter formicarum TaxID=2778368 RepID=A0ABQ3VD39_9CHLR|nr:hypothetical protein KSZ_13190 [Dictyobacter formicarum]
MLIPWREALKRPNKLGYSLMGIGALVFFTAWVIFPLNEHSNLFPAFVFVVKTYFVLMALSGILFVLGMYIWQISARRKWLMDQ